MPNAQLPAINHLVPGIHFAVLLKATAANLALAFFGNSSDCEVKVRINKASHKNMVIKT